MSRLFFLALFVSATSAHAATFNAVVQCEAEGPQFAGTLTIPNQNEVVCKNGMINSVKTPVMLSFNNLTYLVGADRLFADGDSCNVKTMSANAAMAYEKTSDLALGFDMNPTATGYNGRLGRCGFQTK